MITRFFPVVFILIAIAIFFAYINPTYTGQIAQANAQIASYNSALQAAAQFNKQEALLVSEQSQIATSSIQRVTEYLPDGVDNVQLILDLNSLASRSGVALSDFSVVDNATSSPSATGSSIPTLTGGQTASLDLSVSATGTYSAFRTFLGAVEQSLRPMDVTELSVKDSSTGVYTYQMTFRIYWLQ